MNLRSLRRCIVVSTAAIGMVGLSSCCCPCSSKERLLEDFWVSPEQQVERLQQQRAYDPLSPDAIDCYFPKAK